MSCLPQLLPILFFQTKCISQGNLEEQNLYNEYMKYGIYQNDLQAVAQQSIMAIYELKVKKSSSCSAHKARYLSWSSVQYMPES